jgi:hypothetical protein
MRAKAGIGYHGVASLIPLSDLPALSEVSKGEVTISIKTLTRARMKTAIRLYMSSPEESINQ